MLLSLSECLFFIINNNIQVLHYMQTLVSKVTYFYNINKQLCSGKKKVYIYI